MSDLDRVVAYRAVKNPQSGVVYERHGIGETLTTTDLAGVRALVFGGFKQEHREGKKTNYILFVSEQLSRSDVERLEGRALNLPGNRFDRLLRVARSKAEPGKIYVEVAGKRKQGREASADTEYELTYKLAKRTLRINEEGDVIRLAERGKDRITVIVGLPNQKVLGLTFVSQIGARGEKVTTPQLVSRMFREIGLAAEFELLTQIERVVFGTAPVYENEKNLQVAPAASPIEIPLHLAVHNDLDPNIRERTGTYRVGIRMDDVPQRAGAYYLRIDTGDDMAFLTEAQRQQVELGITDMVMNRLGNDLWQDLLVGISFGSVPEGLRGEIHDLFVQLANGTGLAITSTQRRWVGA